MALWTPAQITTALWYDGSDSSTLFDATSGGSLVAADGAIARWEDKSGNGRHATQATSGRRPIRKVSVQNSKDIIRFARASQQWLDLTSVANAIMRNRSYGAIFAVAKYNGGVGDDQTIVNVSRNGSETQLRLGLQVTIGAGVNEFRAGARRLDADAFTGATSANNQVYTLLEARCNYSAGSLSLRVNASQTASASLPSSGSTSNTTSDAVHIGRIGVNNFLDADVAEIVVFDAVPSTGQNELIEGYLAWKWGLQGNLPNDHPYKNAAPRTGIARQEINGSLFNRGLINGSLIR